MFFLRFMISMKYLPVLIMLELHLPDLTGEAHFLTVYLGTLSSENVCVWSVFLSLAT